MAFLTIVAIVPTTLPMGDPTKQLDSLLGATGFAGGMIRRMANYPPQLPPTGARQSTGGKVVKGNARKRTRVASKGYRRTGTLGRGWRLSRLGLVGRDYVSDTTNLVDYTVHVEGDPDGSDGERQTPGMAARGWPNIVDEANAEFNLWRPRIVRVLTQQDVPKPRTR